MKRKILILTVLATITLCSYAQNWTNANLRADGQYILNGVEALYEKVTCGNDEYVLVKFINNNSTKVKLEWIDAVYENGGWTYDKNNTVKTIELQANQEIEGKCNEQNILKIKVSSIIDSPEKFEHYMVSGLSVKNI
jgi:hypothetical protein